MSDSQPVLDVTTSPELNVAPLSQPPLSYTYYHAGPLFNLGDLTNNVRLSAKVKELSNGKFQPILPQDLEQRDTTPHSIRDADLKALLSCDLALFTYDGSELDSGTVVEYMAAKFADMPTVILRTDFRGGGDQDGKGDPWNLMSSFWPRTVGVVDNCMIEYKTGLAKALEEGNEVNANEEAGIYAVNSPAVKIIAAFEAVLKLPARLPKELRTSVYSWLALAPKFKAGTDTENLMEMMDLLGTKEKKRLFD